MLRITATREGEEITLKLEGKLSGPWVEEFSRCWNAATSTCKKESLRVDLTELTFVDPAGKQLLAWVYRQGGRLVGSGLMPKSLIDEITGTRSGGGGDWPQKLKPGLSTIALLLLLPLLLGCRLLRGQDQQAPLQITLREAVQMALRENPQVQIANLNLAQSEKDHTISKSALLPQAQFQLFDKVQRFNLEAFIGKGLPGSPQHAGPFQVFQAGPGFSMPIFDLTLWRRWQESHQGVRASEAQESTVREKIVLLVVSQYLGGMRAAAAVTAARSRVKLAQALHEQAEDLQKHGVGTGLDTLRANVQLQNEKQRLMEAETQYEVSLYGLARLLSLNPHQKIELADQPSFFETPELHANQSLEQAYENRPEMKTLAARERIAQLQRKSAGESRLPKLSLDGGWAYQGLSLPTAIPSYQYQVSVDFPLVTSGRIRAEKAKAALEMRKVDQERLDMRNQITLEVKTAIARLESARNQVDVANLGVKLAREEVSQARDRFDAGVTNNIEVITAQDELARAKDNQIAALYQYNQ